jgi:hypothetical protein
MSKEAIGYVKDMLRQGYDLKDIRSELEKKKWTKRNIDSIIRKATVKEKPRKKNKLDIYQKFILLLGIGITLFMMLWVSGNTGTDLIIIFLSFLPSILSLATVYFVIENYGKKYLLFMFIAPICWCALLYSMSSSTQLSQVEIGNIILLNMVISVVFIALVNIIERRTLKK